MQIIQILVWLFYAYLLIGFVFAIWFVIKGVDHVDDGMKGTKKILRFMLFPGAMALWIVMLRKYLKTRR